MYLHYPKLRSALRNTTGIVSVSPPVRVADRLRSGVLRVLVPHVSEGSGFSKPHIPLTATVTATVDCRSKDSKTATGEDMVLVAVI